MASAHFPPERHSPRDARGFVAAYLDEWHCAAAGDVALLLVSELVTNAVLHAQTETEVEVGRFDDTVRIAVSDGVPAGIDPEAGRHPSRVGAPSGRGLRIVDGLADRWGVSTSDVGKTVWFEVQVPGAPEAERPTSVVGR
jgi:anti-sigma regulatory factor (Ser/Thr protein kinase)